MLGIGEDEGVGNGLEDGFRLGVLLIERRLPAFSLNEFLN